MCIYPRGIESDHRSIDIPPLADSGVQSQSHLLVRLEQRSGARGLGQGGSTLVSLSYINHMPYSRLYVNDILINIWIEMTILYVVYYESL